MRSGSPFTIPSYTTTTEYIMNGSPVVSRIPNHIPNHSFSPIPYPNRQQLSRSPYRVRQVSPPIQSASREYSPELLQQVTGYLSQPIYYETTQNRNDLIEVMSGPLITRMLYNVRKVNRIKSLFK